MKMQHLGGLVNIAIVNFRNISQAQCGWLIDIFLVLDIFLSVMLVCMCAYVLHVSVCVCVCVACSCVSDIFSTQSSNGCLIPGDVDES